MAIHIFNNQTDRSRITDNRQLLLTVSSSSIAIVLQSRPFLPYPVRQRRSLSGITNHHSSCHELPVYLDSSSQQEDPSGQIPCTKKTNVALHVYRVHFQSDGDVICGENSRRSAIQTILERVVGGPYRQNLKMKGQPSE
ncbi:hypothetical protein CEXT_3321 [Caerostris extrusa]|uniref:Uncharacterized protein n=1 Tax=Caerostris extrusa TaxID=172846 RepID=A0AAV4SH74_CAEEX|nr:hypothetical protein CEXT_3321 [Caerostris extrusa]